MQRPLRPLTGRPSAGLTAYTGFFVPDEPGGTQADLRRHLLCLDRRTGKILWQQAIAARLPEEERIRDHQPMKETARREPKIEPVVAE